MNGPEIPMQVSTVFPVEFKHGRKRQNVHDDIQLAAQAMCLEDMLGRHVPNGAIYHASSRRRREVSITPDLRELVIKTATAIRAMLSSGVLPPPSNDDRCSECSLREVCQPEALSGRARQQQQRASLFAPDE
ncbi:MAG: CRISPR-associated protein Cas4 [Betaproteobacteria bacterium]|nr:CRISPR-associated protein Cas4 [Betaproteobacteria bacterium]